MALKSPLVDVNRETMRSLVQEVLDSVVEVLYAKNQDYGDAWQAHGIASVLVRLSDKSLRLENLDGKEALVVDEQVADTLIDIIGYSILGLMYENARKGIV